MDLQMDKLNEDIFITKLSYRLLDLRIGILLKLREQIDDILKIKGY